MRNLRHRLEYALVLTIRALVGVMPDAFARGLGTAIGLFFFTVDRPHRRLAVAQLRAAFPVRSEAECRAIARATFGHFGRALVDVLRTSTLSAEQLRSRVDVEGMERVRTALAHGKGVIFTAGHFGFWELHAIAHSLFMPPFYVVARPLDNPYLHALIERARCATGNKVIYRQGAVRKILRALHANEAVAILIDQHISGADAVRVDFFGRPAATTSAVAALALRTGATVIPVYAWPTAGGRYQLVYEPPIEMPPPDSPDPLREITQRCTDVLEMYVRRSPHLWLWMHRRWRDVDPEDDVSGMFPAAASDERDSVD